MKKQTFYLLFANLAFIGLLASLWYMGGQRATQIATQQQNEANGRAPAGSQTQQTSADSLEHTTVSTPTLTMAVRDLPAADSAPDIVLDREINPRFGLNDHLLNGDSPAPQPDVLWLQTRNSTSTAAPTSFGTPELNFAGIPYNFLTPPDTVGEVGPNYYIQMTNAPGGSSVAIFDKSGNAAQSVFDLDTLGSGDCANGLGDPIVLYDEAAERWFLSEFSANGTNKLCVYISQTADPLGGYYAYEYSAPSFPDYPKYGVWHDAYYVGANENATSGATAAYAFERDAMLAGTPATMIRLTAPDIWGSFDILTPADIDGETEPPSTTPGLLLRQYDDEYLINPGSPNSTEDYIQIWGFSADFNNTANSNLTLIASVPVAEFSSNICGNTIYCIPQPNSSVLLDTVREATMWRAQYRNLGSYETIVGNYVVNADGNGKAGIRWFELRTNNSGDWELYQEGTFSPDNHHYWMGSAATDEDGNLALGYSVSSGTLFPSMGYTGRLANDTLGTLSQGTNRLVTGTSSSSSIRWGDYSALSVDPVDDCTFWFTSMYGDDFGQWNTQISSFKFPNCGKAPIISAAAAPKQQLASVNTTATYTLNLTNTGTISGSFQLSLASEWNAIIEPQAITLDVDQTGTAVISVTVPTTASNNLSASTQISILNQTTQETSQIYLLTIAQSFAGVASGGESAQTVEPGGTDVEYTFSISNTASVTDTFDISVSNARSIQNWGSSLSETSVTLGPGQATDVTLTVTVPADVSNVSETFNVTVTSQTDNSKMAVIPFTTNVNAMNYPNYLPLITVD